MKKIHKSENVCEHEGKGGLLKKADQQKRTLHVQKSKSNDGQTHQSILSATWN